MPLEDPEPTTLSIPSLLLLLVLSFLALRWFLSMRSAPSHAPGSGARGAQVRRVNPEHVEQISQMFPQLGRREIMWDLQRNGGSVAATTERVLGGRGLDVPPPSFQPILPPMASTSTTTSPTRPSEPDLIARYNLQEKITGMASHSGGSEGYLPGVVGGEASAAARQKQGWSQNKSERQELLKRRREEMILSARRKMVEREKEKGMGTPANL